MHSIFALNSVGSGFGSLHPVTSHRLYSTLCLPIMLYGSELWSLTNTKLNIFECTHCKILRTIQGLPTRCPTTALQSLIGSGSISSFISQRQLIFINYIISMQSSDLPKQVLEVRIVNPNAKGITATWKDLVDKLCLPSSNCYSKYCIERNPGKAQSSASSISKLTYPCNISGRTTLGDCALPIGRSAPHWTITLHDTYTTRNSNFRIRLLTGCDGLEADASHFRSRNNHSQPNNPICKLCYSEPEDHFHFIAKCPALSPIRSRLLSNIPTEIAPHLPDVTQYDSPRSC